MKINSNLFWNKKTNPVHDYIKLFYSFETELQQFKCNEYGTKWCSIKRVT